MTYEPMRNKAQVAGNLAQLHFTILSVHKNGYTVGSKTEILAQSLALQSVVEFETKFRKYLN